VHEAARLRHEFLGTEIRILFQAMDRAFAKKAGATLAPAHGTLLLIVKERPNLTQQQLSEAIGLQRSTVTRTIDAFERRGLVRRHARTNDQRSYAIRVTSKGARLAKRLSIIIFGLERQLAKGLSTNQRRLFIQLLRQTQDNLWLDAARSHGVAKRSA
jgi:DNA-binding MarR family transcriptional regulator